MHLVRVNTKLHHHSTEHLDCYNLTPAQFDVLAQLSVAPGISQQALSDHLLVTKGNTCSLLDRMEKKLGLVERCSDPDDRRSHRLFLTEQGRELAEKVIPAHEDFLQDHTSALTEDEQHTLLDLLRRLDRSFEHHKH